jgi:protein involved in polysaccharide export with SLBB domain
MYLRVLFPLLLVAATGFSGGCAAVTNPVADGIPVRRLPAEVLGRPKSELLPIPFTVLKQRESDAYRLDRGDALAIIADNILGGENVQPPVRLPDQLNPNAAVGFPIPVNDDGKISLPRLPLLDVKGKTVTEVEQLIKDAASGRLTDPATGRPTPKLINPDNARITVQLLQKRTYTVTVVREDTQPIPLTGAAGQLLGTNKRGNGYTLRLVAGENDVLRALNATGGPPGLDAKNEIIVERAKPDPIDPNRGTLRIPLRLYPEQQLNLCEADVILKDGDVVKIESRDTASEVFYVAGVAGSRQFPLPRDYDLDVLQALTIVGAPLVNGGFTQNAFVPQAVSSGLGTPSPALLTVIRPLSNGRQIPIRVDLQLALTDQRERIRVLPGDFLVLQERPGDAILRYGTQQLQFTTTAEVIQAGSVQSFLTGRNP